MKEKPYKLVVRLPTAMRERIAESAQLYRRSLNSDIIARLQQSFSPINQHQVPPQANGISPRLEHRLRQQLDDNEEQLLQAFRGLTEQQRSALIKLLT